MSSPYPSSGLFNESSQVPNSCIESAEYIIQATATAKIPAKWTSGAATKPHVWAVFHSHMVNISNTPNFHNLVDSSVKEYPFAGTLPGLGEGLCIVNTGADNKGYNMHFGAVVRVGRGRVDVSDMSEIITETPQLVKIKVAALTKVDDFRGQTYKDSQFIIGKLTTSPPKGLIELKKK